MSEKVDLDGVSFSVHRIGTNYKAEPGVYAFLRDNGDKWGVRYVGETDDLKDRLTINLLTHHRYNCAVTNGKSTHLATRIISGGKKSRLDLETRIRNRYDPPCNRQ